MEQWMQMGRKIRELINPSTMPVAVKFLEEEAQIPKRVRRPFRDLGRKVAPDVILIYVNPVQMMRLVHGATRRTGKPIKVSFQGGPHRAPKGLWGRIWIRTLRWLCPATARLPNPKKCFP